MYKNRAPIFIHEPTTFLQSPPIFKISTLLRLVHPYPPTPVFYTLELIRISSSTMKKIFLKRYI